MSLLIFGTPTGNKNEKFYKFGIWLVVGGVVIVIVGGWLQLDSSTISADVIDRHLVNTLTISLLKPVFPMNFHGEHEFLV